MAMNPEPVAPGARADDCPAGGRAIAGVPTAVTALIGTARRGSINQPEPVGSFADFERIFGGLAADCELGYAVRQFFRNGGASAWVARVPSGSDTRQWLQGLNSLAMVEGFNLLVLPGLADPEVLAAAADTCRQRRAFLIAEAPADARTAERMAACMGSRVLPRSGFGAVYFPWVRIADPLRPGSPRAAPPGGTVAGLYARTDGERGVWRAPAGPEGVLQGVAGLERIPDDREVTRLAGLGVNCLGALANGTVVLGARTLDATNGSDSDWSRVPVRRTALFLEESVERGTQWAAQRPNGPALWAELRAAVGAFLQGLFRRGAFAGPDPASAYWVRCDATTTMPADVAAGEVNIEVGFAPLRPAEFFSLTVRQLTAPPPAPAGDEAPAAGGVARALRRSRGLRPRRPLSR